MGISIPNWRAAAQTSVPGGTATGISSMVRCTNSSFFSSSGIVLSHSGLQGLYSCFWMFWLCIVFEGAATFAHVGFVFVPEEFDAADNGTGGGVAERAEGFAADVIAHVEQQVDVLLAHRNPAPSRTRTRQPERHRSAARRV